MAALTCFLLACPDVSSHSILCNINTSLIPLDIPVYPPHTSSALACTRRASRAAHARLQESQQLIDALLEASAIDLMTQRLLTLKERASEEEESAAHSILTCFQNMVEIDGRVAVALGANDDLFKWLLQRLNPRTYREFTATKATAAETLAIMVQVRDP